MLITPLPFLPHGVSGLWEEEQDLTPIVVEVKESVKIDPTDFLGYTPESAKDLGWVLAQERGWSKQQFNCVIELWTKESNWRYKADNPTSSAYGIPQILGLSEKLTPKEQILRGYDYIEHRYENACNAWAFFQRNNYY